MDKPIELFIAQPRVNDGEPFTRWMTTYIQLEAFALDLRKAVAISQTPEATYKMGSWCRFCNAKTGCPLYQNLVDDIGQMSQDDLAAELEAFADKFDLAIEWGKAGKELMHAEMERGTKISGWKLVNKRATRKWVDDAKAIKHLTKHKIPAADRFLHKIISPAQAEKVLKKAGAPTEYPDGLVESVSSGTTLASESDKRPEVAMARGALEQFGKRLAAD
jgi:hypothetical protein